MTRRVVVIGGDAGGMTAASQAKRRDPSLEVIALERGRYTSYSACGIPYLIGGDVPELDDLIVRTPARFRQQGIDVRLMHEATGIDTAARTVAVDDHDEGRSYSIKYDDLVIGTGALPIRPDLPGIGSAHVHAVQNLEQAEALLTHVRAGVQRVVVVGAGYIGIEMAEAFVKRDAEVVVVERDHQVMGTLDADIAGHVEDAMVAVGIDVRTGVEVQGFAPNAVHTDAGDFPADVVVLGVGVTPNTALAREAGLQLGVKDAIRVDVRQRASAEGVWAAGDCCESYNLVSRRWVHVPLGTHANKQGRVIGLNLAGGYATFPGIVGTAISKLCALEVARTGLTEKEADQAGFACRAVTVTAKTRASYYPGTAPLTIKLVVEQRSGKLLGAQIVGGDGAGKRIDVLATALTVGMTVEQLTGLDLAYAPPFAPVWDPVLTAARAATE